MISETLMISNHAHVYFFSFVGTCPAKDNQMSLPRPYQALTFYYDL